MAANTLSPIPKNRLKKRKTGERVIMACPFLKEGRAQYCLAAPLGKLILEGPGFSGPGRCASSEYYKCELVKKDEPRQARCPHLQETHVQYCGANAPTKLIPFSESQLSSCTTGGYRYCESYLTMARPHGAIAPPSDLLYSSNHFWLAAEESGMCHLGVDSFVADFVGKVDGVTFVTTRGTERPTVALTIHGVEWPMTFPNPLIIQKVNSHLRGDPSRLTADPYGSGWLFCGWELPEETSAGLLSGPPAAAWQNEEQGRLARKIHESLQLTCDGGRPVTGVAQLLSRQQLVCLLQNFFGSRS
jgi:glycine cleavage system H lipoate-binding protein